MWRTLFAVNSMYSKKQVMMKFGTGAWGHFMTLIEIGVHLITWIPGGRFSKVPKLDKPFSGVTIPFVSQERRGFKASNFTVILLFATLKKCQKIGFPKQAVVSFSNGFSGPKSFRDFRETGPWTTLSDNLYNLVLLMNTRRFFF